tara:strand:- start:155 stop:538 length:384 start_codon:yes stop_codon:yes gene_type:complete
MENSYPDQLNKEDCLAPEKYTRAKKTKKDFHSNNEPGQTIVNAVSGTPYYGYKVGSKDEHQFWRVTIPVTNEELTTTAKLFYESPEEYEIHRNVEVDDSIKRSWRNKVNSKKIKEIITDDVQHTTVR